MEQMSLILWLKIGKEIDFDTFRPNLTNFESEDALRVELDELMEKFMGPGRGSWNLRVEMTDNSCVNLGQANFGNVTAYHLIILDRSRFRNGRSFSQTTVTKHEYGEAVGVLLGFPVLLATPILAWIGGRDPETMLG